MLRIIFLTFTKLSNLIFQSKIVEEKLVCQVIRRNVFWQNNKRIFTLVSSQNLSSAKFFQINDKRNKTLSTLKIDVYWGPNLKSEWRNMLRKGSNGMALLQVKKWILANFFLQNWYHLPLSHISETIRNFRVLSWAKTKPTALAFKYTLWRNHFVSFRSCSINWKCQKRKKIAEIRFFI